jgi:hypothetical protein
MRIRECRSRPVADSGLSSEDALQGRANRPEPRVAEVRLRIGGTGLEVLVLDATVTGDRTELTEIVLL